MPILLKISLACFAVAVFLLVTLFTSGCVTSTQVCLECPYGGLALNRTMDTSK